jgi:hypothetical protein
MFKGATTGWLGDRAVLAGLGEAAARYNGVFWLDREEQMKNFFHVGGRRSLKKIDKDEPI